MIAFSAPLAGALAAVTLFAVSAFLSGAVELAHAWETRGERETRWGFVVGALYLATGVYVLLRPVQSMFALALGLGVFLVARGVLMQLVALQLRHTHSWGWFVADGLFTYAGAKLSDEAEQSADKRQLHRTIALSAVALSTVSGVAMKLWNK